MICMVIFVSVLCFVLLERFLSNLFVLFGGVTHSWVSTIGIERGKRVSSSIDMVARLWCKVPRCFVCVWWFEEEEEGERN